MPDDNAKPDDLLDAIDELTKPILLHQTITESKFSCVVADAALLDRLESEIRFSLSREASTSSAGQRIPINSGALQLFMRISSQINDWANMARSTVYKGNPSRTLRAWYVVWVASPREHPVMVAKAKVLHGWAGQIRRELEPPRQQDLPDPCPACGAVEWWRDGERYPRPLVIESPRNPVANLIDESRALCRACEKVWRARDLADVLDTKKDVAQM